MSNAPRSLPVLPGICGGVDPQPEGWAQGCLDLRAKFKAKRKFSLNGRAACMLGPKEDGGEFLVKLYNFLLSPPLHP